MLEEALSPHKRSNFLIETDELEHLLSSSDTSNIKIVNATLYLPNEAKDAREEHFARRITEDTVFFDHDIIADQSSPLPHSLPSLLAFVNNMKILGI